MRDKLASWAATTVMILLIPALLMVMASGAFAGRPSSTAGSCNVEANVVSATGLPTDQVVNFMVTNSSGTSGWVLGTTWEGTWALSVPARDGWTLYEFVSKTWGKNGSKHRVFASCSAN